MAPIIPTITDVLIQTSTADCRHSWPVQGGSITLTRAELLPALEAAYDPTMANWPAMVEIDDDDNSWPLDGDDYFSGNDNA